MPTLKEIKSRIGSVQNTLKISVMKLVFTFPVPVILALMMNAVPNGAYKRVVQTVSYMPHFISWVTLSGLFILKSHPRPNKRTARPGYS